MSETKGIEYYKTLLCQQALNRIHNINAGPEDGQWGSKTQKALDVFAWYEQKKDRVEDKVAEPKVDKNIVVPSPEPHKDTSKFKKGLRQLFEPPSDNVAALVDFYGPYGIKDQREPDLVWFTFPYPMRLYDTKQVLSRHRCHRKVKESLEAVLETARDELGLDFIKEHNLDTYYGVYNPRPMRGNSNSISRHCLPAGTQVYTSQGIVNIENLKLRDKVLSFNEGSCVEKPIVKFFKNGKKNIVTVNYRGGVFKCSEDHKIKVLKKTAGSGRGIRDANYELIWKKAADLERGDKLISLKQHQLHPRQDKASPEWAEILGLFIGDGCVHHRNGIPDYVSFSIPEGDRIRQHAFELINNFFGGRAKQNKHFIFLYHKQDYEKFLEFNKKACYKTVPKEVWGYSASNKLRFLEGYIYSDGCVIAQKSGGQSEGFSSVISLKSGSKTLMEELRLIFSTLNFRVSQLNYSKTSGHFEGYDREHESWKFTARDLSCSLDLSHDPLYKERIEKSSKPNNNSARCQGYHLLGEDFRTSSVISVEYSGEEETYDIEVADTHNFIVDGQVVSNSWAAAIDINADQNRFQTPWQKDKIGQRGYANMPVEFIEIFESFGWKSGAKAWGKDAMHFQLTK